MLVFLMYTFPFLTQWCAVCPAPPYAQNTTTTNRLHNPLQRQERLSTGWFGVICSFDGVVVEDTHHAQARAWLQVAEEMNLPRPLGQTLNRIKGARDEVVSALCSLVWMLRLGRCGASAAVVWRTAN